MREVNLTKATGNSIFRATDKVISVTMSPSQNITGWGLAFVVKTRYGASSSLISKSSGSGISITDALNGVFTITLDKADTSVASTPAGRYVYEVYRTDSGNEDPIVYGALELLERVPVN